MLAKIIKIKKIATNIYSYFLEPEKKLNFDPGFFIYIEIPEAKNSDPRGSLREFSIDSSPTENFISFTTIIPKKSSIFKKHLINKKEGDFLNLEKPMGVYSWPQKGPHLFIAGGIGITPFRSRLKYNFDKKIKSDITVLYLTKSPTHSIYISELESWHSAKHINLITHYSQNNGRIDKNIIKKLTNKSTTHWITGSPSFVDDFENYLYNLKVPQEKIKTEKFTGLK